MNSAHFLAGRMIAPILAAGFTCVSAWAQYPTKPITLVVGFPAGGPTDLVARLFAWRNESGVKCARQTRPFRKLGRGSRRNDR